MEIKKAHLVKEIPGISGFYATTDGKILNGEKDQLNIYLKDKYNWVFIKGIEYKVATLVLKAFVPIPNYLNGVPMANHFDLDKTNDKLENLDWVDRKWNAIHNYLMNPNKESLISHIKYEGNIKGTSVKGMTADLELLGKFIGVTAKEVWEALKSGEKIKGFTLKYMSKVTKTDSGSKANQSVARDSSKYGESYTSSARAIKMMDVYTMEITEYKTMSAAARAHEVRLTHIRNRLSTPDSPKIFKKKYIIVDADKGFGWVTPEIIKILKARGDNRLVVFNGEKETFDVYDSVRDFMETIPEHDNRRNDVTSALRHTGQYKFSNYFISYLPVEREQDPDLFLIEVMFGLCHRPTPNQSTEDKES